MIYTAYFYTIYLSYTCIIIFCIYAYAPKKLYRQIRQNIIRYLFLDNGNLRGWLGLVFCCYTFGISQILFNKLVFYNDKKLLVWRLESKRTDKKPSSESCECQQMAEVKWFPGLQAEAELPKSEKRGHLCPLLSTFSKCPVILNPLLASISCGGDCCV